MTTATTNSGFADSKAARILAALIAVALAIILFVNWSDDFSQLMSGKEASALPDSSATTQDGTSANPALASCFAQRVGDVDKMKEEGILSDAQYAAFRDRAESLCRQQNPGQ